jgi:hypothetical protein
MKPSSKSVPGERRVSSPYASLRSPSSLGTGGGGEELWSLTVEAAVTGDPGTAVLALLAHPLVGDYEKAKALFADLLEANRTYLPAFN